jgi:RNA polymerase sigma factor for flagellar operon FliA
LTSHEPTPLRAVPTAVPDSPEALERFHGSLALVDIIAAQVRRNMGTIVELDDLVANGREGLLDAARRYEPSRGVPFRVYANYRVRGAMIDGVRKAVALPRRAYERLVALQAASNVSESETEFGDAPEVVPSDVAEAEALLAQHLEAMITGAALAATFLPPAEDRAASEEDPGENPEEALARAELMASTERALKELSPEANEVVRRHFLGGERLEDIARDYEMSKSWASRLLTRTMASLAKQLRAHV